MGVYASKINTFSFYIAPNTIKYFPECKQTPEKQTFSKKSFASENILRQKMFYVETNGAEVVSRHHTHVQTKEGGLIMRLLLIIVSHLS